MVKLGTITKEDADVFSYDEDESVRDPNLAMHLMHFGIDVQTAEKTEKSTLELELDMNQKFLSSLLPLCLAHNFETSGKVVFRHCFVYYYLLV